jgi:hypothetical protein
MAATHPTLPSAKVNIHTDRLDFQVGTHFAVYYPRVSPESGGADASNGLVTVVGPTTCALQVS